LTSASAQDATEGASHCLRDLGVTGLDGQLPQSVASPRLSLTWLRSVNLHPADHPWKTVRLLPTNEKLLNSSYRIRGKVIKMDKLRKIFIAAMISLVVSSIAVYALTSWTHTFNWNLTATTDFKVFDNATGQEITTSGSTPSISNGYSITYKIWNIGNVRIRVTGAVSFSLGSATTAWNPSNFVDIDPNQNQTLTLTFNTLSGGIGAALLTFNSAQV
jgi:hypothetical protein